MKKYVLLLIPLVLLMSVHATSIYGGNLNTRWEVKEFLQKAGASKYVYRIDLADYENKYYTGYAWYKERRIILYKNAWNTSIFQTILQHEIGHLVCEQRGGNKFNYQNNEECAEQFMLRNNK